MQQATPKKAQPPKRNPKPTPVERQLCVLRYSPCGKVLAAGDYVGGVLRWDASGDGLKPMEPLAGHSGWVQSLAFHTDGKTLFSADSWGRLCAWPFAEKAPQPLWNVADAHNGWIRQIAVSPDGKMLASCDNGGVIRFWSPDRGKMTAEWLHEHDLLSLAFAPDGKTLVLGDLFGTITRRDVATGKVVMTYQAKEMHRLDRIQDVGGVRCLLFTPDGKTLIACGSEVTTGGFVTGQGLLVYFDAASGKRTQTVKLPVNLGVYVCDVAWDAQGYLMAVTSGQPGLGQLIFHRPGEAAPFFVGPMGNTHSLAVQPQTGRVVCCTTSANSSGNGRNLNQKKEYPSNSSLLYVWDVPKS